MPDTPDAITTIMLNRPPVAETGGPYTVAEGGSVTLDAAGSTDPDLPDDVLTYEWDFDGDGEYDDATGIQPTFSGALIDGPTSVTVGLRVTDSSGEFDTLIFRPSWAAPQSRNPDPSTSSGQAPLDYASGFAQSIATQSDPNLSGRCITYFFARP